MALFKKKTPTPAASPAPATTAPAGNSSDDFSDFSPEALDATVDPAVDAAAAKGKKGRKAGREKKTSSGRALKPGVAIGLNIGSDSIKAVEMRVKGNELSITGMGMVPTPAESISNGVVMSVNSLSLGIRDALAQAGIKSKKVVTAVSGTGALVVRIIEVPKMSDGELADNMKMDADRYIPFPPSEVIMDFTALRELPSDPDSANMEVLLAAAQREVIDLHVQVLQDAKLDPRSIDVEPLAAARILTHPLVTGISPMLNGDDATANAAALEPEVDYSDVIAILNIGASGTEISILRGDILVFTRTVPTAGNALTQALVDTLGLAWSDAEQLKREMGDALAPSDSAAAGSTPVAPTDDLEGLDWTEPAADDAEGDEWNDFAPESEEAEDAFIDETSGDETFSDETFSDETFVSENSDDLPTDVTPGGFEAAPVSEDPFADDFYDQGPSDFTSGNVQNAEPQEQHQQKEPDDSPFSFGDLDSPSSVDDVPAEELPTYEGALTGTEKVAGNLSTPEPEEESLLPSTIAQETESIAPVQSATASATSINLGKSTSAVEEATADAPTNPFFDFGHAEEIEDKLPTLQEGRPTSFADFLTPEEDVFSELPTLRDETSSSVSIPSAFEFPVESLSAPPKDSDIDFADFDLPSLGGAPSTTEGVNNATRLDEQDESLLPTETKPDSNAFSFSFEDTPVTPALTPTAVPVEAAPSPAEVDPFAEFMATAETDEPAAAGDVAPVAISATPSTPAAVDNLDLDILFGASAAGSATQAAADDLDFSGLDVGDDFGMDDTDFGAGLTGAAVGEIDAKTLHDVLDPVLEALVNEVRRSLEYHTTRYPDAAVQRVLLIGGGAKLKNIDAYFTQKLGLPTTVGNPASRLVLRAPNLPAGYADENGTLFAVALGLAMRELTR